MNIRESIPEHNDLTALDLDYEEISDNKAINFNINLNNNMNTINSNFSIDNNNNRQINNKNNYANYTAQNNRLNKNYTGDNINLVKINDKQNDNEKNTNNNPHNLNNIQFFESTNFHVNNDDIQNQIKQNKQNLRVISETDLMTKSLKKARNKYIHNYSSYEQAVKMLKSINRYRVPFEKMILIATLASEITECVNEFWKDFENIVTSSLLNIDADELMTIFIYVVIKSHMPELLIHAKFIKEFTTSNSRSTMIGYYFTTLEASIIYILSVKDKDDLRNKDKDVLFSSLMPNKISFLNNTELNE